LCKRGAWSDAVEELSRAIRVDPTSALAHEYRAAAYLQQGMLSEAIGDYSETIRLQPLNDRAYANRGSVYHGMGEVNRALIDFNECIRLNGTNALGYVGRAAVYDSKGLYVEEVEDLDTAISLSSGDSSAFLARGRANSMIGQFAEAVRDYRKAIQLDPTNDRAYNEFAWLRATCLVAEIRNGKQAIEAATKACELTGWSRGEWIDTLAASYAEAGDFESAIRYEKQAIGVAAEDSGARAEMLQRLSLYEKGRAYRQESAGR
jgi:tetratricopeptide (TPR) repeat protein